VTYRIEYTQPALRDLRELETYLRAAGGDLVADRFIDKIVAKVRSLQDRPMRQRVRTEFGPGLRAVAIGSQMIFYRVDGDTVRIVRVLHGSRNITAKLFVQRTPEE
jgi:toxin ParE1/3/4